jgi:hypothetical protein
MRELWSYMRNQVPEGILELWIGSTIILVIVILCSIVTK